MGTPDVVPVRVANLFACALVCCLGLDWICGIREVSLPLLALGIESNLRRIGAAADGAAIPAHRDHWKNFGLALGWRHCRDALADLGRDDALRCQARV